MTLIDDPVASVGVGPGGWLVQVGTSADWIGDYEGSEGSCQWGCAWCDQGQSLCHGGFAEDGTPTCFLCLPTDNSPEWIVAAGQACATFVANNPSCDGGTPPGGAGGTSGGGGADESGGADGSSGSAGAEYDCNLWDIAGAASATRTTITLDEATLEEAVQHFGAPLTDCDDTRFSQDSSGYFVLSRTSSAGLLSQMGLQVGDRIETVNGDPILSADDAANQVVKLSLLRYGAGEELHAGGASNGGSKDDVHRVQGQRGNPPDVGRCCKEKKGNRSLELVFMS